MPMYTYRREDGTTFDLRQKFNDEPLTVDPESGQKVARVVQAAGIIFKGSGFYVNDSKGGSSSTLSNTSKSDSDTKSETKKEPKTETKTESTKTTIGSAAD